MEYELEDQAPSGWAGFLEDLVWEIGQIGQAVLDGVTLVLVGLLIYHHAAVLSAARQVEVPAVQTAPPLQVTCASGLASESFCIEAQVLAPSDG